jgi:CBS domain-containing protein
MRGRATDAMTLTVADVMTLDPVVIGADAALEEAERLLRERHVSGLPVVDDDQRLIGVISRTDLLDDGSASLAFLLRRRPTGLRVGELMTSPPITTSLGTPLVEAARLMRDNRIHRIVAIDDAGRPVGVLAASDFVALYADS